MRLSIGRNDLARLLASTTKVVEARNTLPILSTVRLVADAGKLTATATDLDIEITASAAAEGSLEVCVDAKLLAGIVAKAGADITLETKDNSLIIKSGRGRWTLYTLPVADFPSFNHGDFTTEFTIDLAALFAPAKFAMSDEATRYYLNGIYLVGQTGRLTAVATDGHRLSRNVIDERIDAPPLDFPGIIVPRKTVDLVPKGEITVALSDTKIRFTAGDTVVTSKLIDGTFPDYQRVIPRNNDKVVTFNSPEMKQAAERVSVVSSARERAVLLSLVPGQVTLTVNDPDAGNAVEEVAVGYDGEPVEVGFNGNYLAELIGQFPAGEIRLALADGGSPTLFTSDGAPGLLCVLMPRRV